MITPAWAYHMIETIQRSDYAEIMLVIKPTYPSSGYYRSLSRLARFRHAYNNNFTGFVGKLVAKGLEWLQRVLIERRTYVRNSEQPHNLSDLLEQVPQLEVTPIRTKWSDTFTNDDVQELRTSGLDVMVRLGFRILRGGVLAAARYGVWSYHHGDNTVNRGGPPGFWETMESWPETGSILQILTEDVDNGAVLCRSYSCTYSNSVNDNKSSYYWKSAAFIPRKLRELHRDGGKAFFANVAAQNSDPLLYSRPLYRHPSNAQQAGLFVRKLRDKTVAAVRARLQREQWILLYDLRPTLSSSFWRYKRMLPPKDRFWADPHAVQYQDRHYIFIEELIYAKDRGHISVIEVLPDGTYTTAMPIIERDYHLSYPFVFEHEGQWYLIPETASQSVVQLYRATEFPYQWEFQHNLLEGEKFYDATLLNRDGKWWLFANKVDVPGASSWDELHVYQSDSPLSQSWIPHPANPVVSDCKSARPAGRFLELNGRLYRPSQNSSHRYGYGFNLARVDVLDDTHYREEIIARVEPKWAKDLLATHTFSKAGNLHVIDAQIRRWR